MDSWNYLELAAWAASAVFGLLIVIDWIRIDSTYDEEFLTSSREGDLEALTEEQHGGQHGAH